MAWRLAITGLSATGIAADHAPCGRYEITYQPGRCMIDLLFHYGWGCDRRTHAARVTPEPTAKGKSIPALFAALAGDEPAPDEDTMRSRGSDMSDRKA